MQNCDVRVSFCSLPPEIIIEISLLGSAFSQKSYRSILLTSRMMHRLARLSCIQAVPIRIGAFALRSFQNLLERYPELAPQVRHLWITGTSERVANIVTACVNLVTLACSSYVFVSTVSAYAEARPEDGAMLPGEIRHRLIRELTLFDNWDCWSYLAQANGGTGLQICRNITHLRVHDNLAPDFPTSEFRSLTHFSSSSRPLGMTFPHEIQILQSLERLTSIVNCTYFWKLQPPDERTELTRKHDKRLRFIYFGGLEPSEFELWCGRTRGGGCIWTKMPELRMLC
ncbi:hypothetical protein FA15DRAFT_167219 [Coprinopsis marcescibilis]|uniref:F-box domain-containing protein n=1 Tax=Coprinopsis marcescibilis TaxID=230819 RepID=A0A5C3KII4_COPMA|nr:hypothetical protein FA15DRAFT_167219 [Coprinopsis marcescibilis]